MDLMEYSRILTIAWIWFQGNWGNLASVMGTGVTIYFAIGAQRAAEAARIASEQTKTKLSKVDLIHDLTRVSSALDDLHVRISLGSLDMIVERSNIVRQIIGPISQMESQSREDGKGILKEETANRLSEMGTQMREISRSANSAQERSAEFRNVARTLEIVNDYREAIAIAISEVKSSLGEVNE